MGERCHAMLQWMAGLMLLGVLAFALASLGGCDSAEPYQRKNGDWAFDDRPLAERPVGDLKVLSRRFAKTATQAYYRQSSIAGADAASFEALDEHHARDREHVYYGDTYRISQDYFTTQRIRITVLAGADPASFQLLSQGYARDAHQAYYEGEPFHVRDVASLEVLDYGFARDKHSGYYLRTPVANSGGDGFEVLSAHYARDARQVFYAGMDYRVAGPPRVRTRRLSGADLASFKALESGYALDAAQVYWEGQAMQGADAASFTLLSPSTSEADARDAKRQYLRGRPVAS